MGKMIWSVLVLSCLMWASFVPAQAQVVPPTIQLRTVTLIPLQKDSQVQGGFMLDVHVWPVPKTTDKWYLKVQDVLAKHTSIAWFQTSDRWEEIGNLDKGSLGANINFMAREAAVNAGVVYRQQEHKWFGHLDFSF